MKLSIIVPVYNVEKYVVQCISSLLQYKTAQVEIIVVNDGSPDQSGALIQFEFMKEIQAGDLVYLEQCNQGVSVARNHGIAHAQGDYIGFVDADDYVAESYFYEVLHAIDEGKTDIIEFGWFCFSDEHTEDIKVPMYVHQNFGLLNAKEVLEPIFAASIWYSCCRVIKRELIGATSFPPGVRFCEDMMFLYDIYDRAASIFHIKMPLYAYRQNTVGATALAKPEYIQPMFDLYRSILDRDEKHFDYLKASIVYVVFSCSLKIGCAFAWPADLYADLLRLRLRFLSLKMLSVRKMLILIAPGLLLKWKSRKAKNSNRSL
ncbi:glycosyltransferase family 2 protein [Chitinibacter tainanensis]|uniref:glycosyltransferase family 2 protein n=1 Tax=Chitinibacter tainanensis TaxID=230667 RepID=UPI0003F78C76|nr:glycosyltransferase family 2 protein [Chitinibacter tainanensis]